jgi:hypothetical protein
VKKPTFSSFTRQNSFVFHVIEKFDKHIQKSHGIFFINKFSPTSASEFETDPEQLINSFSPTANNKTYKKLAVH